MSSFMVSGPFVTHFFKLPKDVKKYIYSLTPKFGFDAYGETVFYRTYSRTIYQNGEKRQESWADVVIRVTEGTMSIRKNHHINHYLSWDDNDWMDFAKEFAISMFHMRFLPPGRGLWACGTKFMYERGSAALNNCGAAETTDFVLSAVWTKDMLMNGCGIGFDTVWKGEYIIPDKNDNFTYVIPDSREGWVESVALLLSAYIPMNNTKWRPEIKTITYGKFPLFDYSKVRPSGEPIRGFGGVASGPDPLKKLHHRIEIFMDTYIAYQELQKQDIKALAIEEITTTIANVLENPASKDKWIEKLKSLDKNSLTSDLSDKIYNKRKLDIFVNMITRFEDIGISCGDRESLISKFKEHILVKTYNKTRCVVDIMNSLGACVVAGNVRRSAMIAIGEIGDDEFLNLKNYDLNPERANIGWMSNNSIRFKESSEFATNIPIISKRIRDNGEPGFINQLNINRFGRVGRRFNFDERWTRESEPDLATLANPCSEISLESYELCCLSELLPTRCIIDGIFNEELYLQAAKFAHFYAATVSLLPTHWTMTNEIISRNHRIGISKSGTADFYDLYGCAALTRLCRITYKLIRDENRRLARQAGVCESVRVTTNKPCGNLSGLTGVSPGIHFPTFKYAVRRIRIAENSPLSQVLKDANIPWEKDSYSDNTLVFEFPIDQGKTRPAKEVSIWEQFSILAMFQREWSDNMVSVTIYFNPETEGHQIEYALAQFAPQIKSCSMLPHTDDGVYIQAPYQGIDVNEYNRRKTSAKSISWSKFSGDGIMPRYCTNDTCEL